MIFMRGTYIDIRKPPAIIDWWLLFNKICQWFLYTKSLSYILDIFVILISTIFKFHMSKWKNTK